MILTKRTQQFNFAQHFNFAAHWDGKKKIITSKKLALVAGSHGSFVDWPSLIADITSIFWIQDANARIQMLQYFQNQDFEKEGKNLDRD